MTTDLEDFRYRVVRRDGKLAVREVYFDASGKAVTATEGTFSPSLPSLEDLKYELNLIVQALEEPIIEWEQIEPSCCRPD